MIKKLFSISDEVASRLNLEKNQSAFVDSLLHVYYGLSPNDPARQELAILIATNLQAEVMGDDPPLPTEETQPKLVTPSPESPQTDTVTEGGAIGTDEPQALAESPTPLVEPPMVPALAQATSEPCEHGVIPPAVCIDCI